MQKIFTIGIILLFIGMTISSSTGFNLEKQSTVKTFNGKTLYVGGDGPGNYSKIQDAINDSSDGDTVFVFNGTYNERLLIESKSINLIGEDKNITIIEGNISIKKAKNILVTGFTIQKTSVYCLLFLELISHCNISRNNLISLNNGCCIELYHSRNNIVSENTITRHPESSDSDYGILIMDSLRTTVTQNTVIGQSIGISITSSWYNNISHNVCMNNSIGIESWGSLPMSRNNVIYKNILANNNYGIFIDEYVNRNIIAKNQITNNARVGFYVIDCNNNLIVANHITNNGAGLYAYNSFFNRFHYNNFAGNEIQNILDEGINLWFKPSFFKGKGNYWDDYTGTDKNGDGIGDTPYNIPPSKFIVKDRFPFMEPVDIENVELNKYLSEDSLLMGFTYDEVDEKNIETETPAHSGRLVATEEGLPKLVYISGNCCWGIMEFGRMFHLGPFCWCFYVSCITYNFNGDAWLVVNGQRQTYENPTGITLVNFKGWAPNIHLAFLKQWIPFARVRIFGICDEVIVYEE
ncbi:MAG: right-handed parallel beta-helix repeat-containing protein [Petrotogales bacterium]